MTIYQLSRQIHRKGTRIWMLTKAMKGIEPYCWRLKNLDIPAELVKDTKEFRQLRKQREELKASTPKNLLYPRRKYCGRYKGDSSKAITQVMRDAYMADFNVKTIAGYFNYTLPTVYRRIKIKEKISENLK